ncbi:uncharacterized protein LOC135397016 [Ornithodoros turicata]|uniref:uncharacterized protein LOC135397016 n=1 Tax=Ornithodoros turicata TaxID=34597 RepID=UPI003139C5E8
MLVTSTMIATFSRMSVLRRCMTGLRCVCKRPKLSRIAKPLGTVCLAGTVAGMAASDTSEKVEDPDSKALTHRFLLKQASALAIDAIARILTELTTAITDVHDEYIESMTQLLVLMNNYSEYLSNCSGEDELWLEVIAVRSRVAELKAKSIALQSRLRSMSDLVEAAAQVAFVNGADYAGISANERLMSAEQHIRASARRVAALEKELLEAEKNIILSSDAKEAQEGGVPS